MIEALKNLGVSYSKIGDHASAARHFGTLIAAHPKHAEGYLFLGLIELRHLGRPREAVVHLEKYLEYTKDPQTAAKIRDTVEKLKARLP